MSKVLHDMKKGRNLWEVSVEEFIGSSDFDDFEAFLNEVCRELPELFKASVAVKDGADVFCRVVSSDSEIVCHNCFLLSVVLFERVLRHKFLERIDTFFIERRYHCCQYIWAELIYKICNAFVAFDFYDNVGYIVIVLAIAFKIVFCPFRLFGKHGIIAFELRYGIDFIEIVCHKIHLRF